MLCVYINFVVLSTTVDTEIWMLYFFFWLMVHTSEQTRQHLLNVPPVYEITVTYTVWIIEALLNTDTSLDDHLIIVVTK